jgi:phosphoribosyl 1,2-cyclic phosphate phosphodiesterase
VVETEKEKILIDASPDLRYQLIREGIESIDHVFVTHWHYDHFGGLGDLEFYVRLKKYDPISLYLPPEAITSFQAAFPFLLDVFQVIPWSFGEVYNFCGVSLMPLPALHYIQTAGILLRAGKSLAYFTDTAGLPDSTCQRIKGTVFLFATQLLTGITGFPTVICPCGRLPPGD